MPTLGQYNHSNGSNFRFGRSRKRNELLRKIRQQIRAFGGKLTRLPRGVGLAMAVVFLLITVCYSMAIGGTWRAFFENLTAQLGFSVQEITISGISKLNVAQILHELELDTKQDSKNSLVFLSTQNAKERIQEFPWVESVSIQKLYPRNLEIKIQEKQAYALWQRDNSMSIIDKHGDVITDFVESKFFNLPILIGHGSQRKASEIIEPLRTYPELTAQVRAYRLVSRRRWDLILDNGITIRLPEDNLQTALLDLEELEDEFNVFSKDISVIDLRLADRIVFRLSENAVNQKNTSGNVTSGNLQAESET